MLMSQWDIFITSEDTSFAGPNKVFFKQIDEGSYRMFRELMQLIDCAVMDVQTAQYKPAVLVSSFMYLLIGR